MRVQNIVSEWGEPTQLFEGLPQGAMELQALEDVGDEGAREVAGEALDRGGTLIEERGKVGGGLILFAKDVVLVFKERLAGPVGQIYGYDNRNEKARRLLRGCVVRERRDDFFQNGSAKHDVWISALFGGDVETRAGGELADDRVGDRYFSVVGLSARGKDRDRKRARVGRQVRGSAQSVISAARQAEQRGGRDEEWQAHSLQCKQPRNAAAAVP